MGQSDSCLSWLLDVGKKCRDDATHAIMQRNGVEGKGVGWKVRWSVRSEMEWSVDWREEWRVHCRVGSWSLER